MSEEPVANKRSPLKDRPLRNPGQSLDEEIGQLISDYALGPVVFAPLMVSITALEWAKYYQSAPPSPLVYSAIAVPSIAYAVLRFFSVRHEVKNRKLGRDGEKAVGQFLEQLRGQGYRVFHDVIGDGFNLDHVLIGPAGVFTVETKTHSKPARNARIDFDGEIIRIDGCEPDRSPVVQARAQASWLREILCESTGREFKVRSVIVYPGWFVDHTGPRSRSIWVLNAKALPTFLEHEPPQLSGEEIQLVSFHLSRFIRAESRAAD